MTPSRPRVVVVRPCYGGTESSLAGPLGNLGVKVSTVDMPADGAGITARSSPPPSARMLAAVVTEVVTNPLIGLVDVPAVAAAAHAAGAACIVDSTFTPAFLFQPFAHGADLVIHSLTKYLSGHSDVIGGVLLIDAGQPGW